VVEGSEYVGQHATSRQPPNQNHAGIFRHVAAFEFQEIVSAARF
jgi:hypothetical protein